MIITFNIKLIINDLFFKLIINDLFINDFVKVLVDFEIIKFVFINFLFNL